LTNTIPIKLPKHQTRFWPVLQFAELVFGQFCNLQNSFWPVLQFAELVLASSAICRTRFGPVLQFAELVFGQFCNLQNSFLASSAICRTRFWPVLQFAELVFGQFCNLQNSFWPVLRFAELVFFCFLLISNIFCPGVGGRKTRLITFPNAIRLVMALPGDGAEQSRQLFADILTRYFAGDQSIAREAAQNAKSDDPLSNSARESLKRVREEDGGAAVDVPDPKAGAGEDQAVVKPGQAGIDF